MRFRLHPKQWLLVALSAVFLSDAKAQQERPEEPLVTAFERPASHSASRPPGATSPAPVATLPPVPSRPPSSRLLLAEPTFAAELASLLPGAVVDVLSGRVHLVWARRTPGFAGSTNRSARTSSVKEREFPLSLQTLMQLSDWDLRVSAEVLQESVEQKLSFLRAAEHSILKETSHPDLATFDCRPQLTALPAAAIPLWTEVVATTQEPAISTDPWTSILMTVSLNGTAPPRRPRIADPEPPPEQFAANLPLPW